MFHLGKFAQSFYTTFNLLRQVEMEGGGLNNAGSLEL